MTTAIEFLERIGADAALRHADASTLKIAMQNSNLDVICQTALLTRDTHTMEAALGATRNVCAIIYPVEIDVRTAAGS